MKIALLTANIGNIDEIRAPVKQRKKYDFFYFTENTLPFPLPNLDNRMKGKYFKTQAHKFLDHDIFIWIDGSRQVKDGTFIDWVIESLTDDIDIMIALHSERKNVYEEIEYVQAMIKNGSQYLLNRYANQPFDAEYNFYRKEGLPASWPLFQCSFFARWNSAQMNDIFDQWWDMILRYTNFDQTQFSYVMWKNEPSIKVVETEVYLDIFKHKKMKK